MTELEIKALVELAKVQYRASMPEFQIYRLVASDTINGAPRRGWFIVYPSGVHVWIEAGNGNYLLREELCPDAEHCPGSYDERCEFITSIAQYAHTARYNVPVGVYKEARTCAAQNRLPRLSRGTYVGDWIWA